MSNEKPRVYLFHGDDHRRRAQALEKLRRGLNTDGDALDYVRLEGETLTLPQLQDAVLTLPFFSRRRLVHVVNPLACPKLKSAAKRKAFLGVLDAVPLSCALVLDVPKTLPEKHWLRQWAAANPQRAFQRAMPLPSDLRRWILAQAKEEGGAFTPAAAAELARRVGNDAAWALNEVRKLLAYVGYRRPVDVEDVHELTPAAEHPDVFAMVDALALGQGERALRLLHQLLVTEEARYGGAAIPFAHFGAGSPEQRPRRQAGRGQGTGHTPLCGPETHSSGASFPDARAGSHLSPVAGHRSRLENGGNRPRNRA